MGGGPVEVELGVEGVFEEVVVEGLVGGGGVLEGVVDGLDEIEEDGGVVVEGLGFGEFVGFGEEELVEAILKKLFVHGPITKLTII